MINAEALRYYLLALALIVGSAYALAALAYFLGTDVPAKEGDAAYLLRTLRVVAVCLGWVIATWGTSWS